MKLSAKHPNAQRTIYNDFSAGLNSSMAEDTIAENELREVVNMEIDREMQLLRTCKGTVDICKFDYGVTSAAYDVINGMFLLFTSDRKIITTYDFKSFKEAGTLTGESPVITASWENGLLIASGGRLQYSTKRGVKTLQNSPIHSKGAYIRSGRVLTFDGADNVKYSSVGDEDNWDIDAGDPSKALFAQIGYKVGGKILGMVNLSKDILFIKDNGMVFRLENEYPDWKISELGRNIYCKNGLSFCNIGEQVIILGNGILQSVQTTQDYGDMKPTDIGKKVKREIASLEDDTKLRYIPSINQLWFISHTKYVLVMDCDTGAFFQRTFNEPVVDVICVDEDIYIVRDHAVSKFTEDFVDSGLPLSFTAKFKSAFSLNEILVKKINFGITPYKTTFDDTQCYLKIGKVRLAFPDRRLTGDNIVTSQNSFATIPSSSDIHRNQKIVFADEEFVTPTNLISMRVRCISRTPMVRMQIWGEGFSFIMNYIGYDWVEV